jgi:hypothetical protein
MQPGQLHREMHVGRVLGKLRLRDRVAGSGFGYENGLVSRGDRA